MKLQNDIPRTVVVGRLGFRGTTKEATGGVHMRREYPNWRLIRFWKTKALAIVFVFCFLASLAEAQKKQADHPDKQLGVAKATVIKALPQEKSLDVRIVRDISAPGGPALPATKPGEKLHPYYNFLIITVHLYEGYKFDDPTSILKKGNPSRQELEKIANDRCVDILKAMWPVRRNLPYVDNITIVTRHGVNQLVKLHKDDIIGLPGGERSREIYALSMPFSDFLNSDIPAMQKDEIIKRCKVEFNYIRSMDISSKGVITR
jgi:hypothetical protein